MKYQTASKLINTDSIEYLRYVFPIDPTKPHVKVSHPSSAHLEAIDELNTSN